MIDTLIESGASRVWDVHYADGEPFTEATEYRRGVCLNIAKQVLSVAQDEIPAIDEELIAKGWFQKQVASARKDVLAWPQWLKDHLRDSEPPPDVVKLAPELPNDCCRKCEKKRMDAEIAVGIPFPIRLMVCCPICGNKRCPKASDHDLACTGSNEPNQPGSAYHTKIEGPQS